MTSSDSGESIAAPAPPASQTATPQLAYGNIYTPHAGSMIIQVQRESGLQSRTIVLTPHQVRLLRVLTSRTGKILAAGTIAVLALISAEAARVPALTREIGRMEHTATRLDTLERSLTALQHRYDQVRAILGADSATSAQRAIAGNLATAASLPAAPGATIVPPARSDVGADGQSGPAPLDSAAPAARPRTRRRRLRAAAPPPVIDSAPRPDSAVTPSPQAEPQL